MEKFNPTLLKNLYIPPTNSHKGQNGKLLIIAGSPLFHAASLWALKTASRIVDMVFYSSVPENNEIVQNAKSEFPDGIVIRRDDIENYIAESDCILIGPGMERMKNELRIVNNDLSLEEINFLQNEGEKTYHLTKYLLIKYPEKKWVIDAGALQEVEPEIIPPHAIITPHAGEFERLKLKIKNLELKNTIQNLQVNEQVQEFVKEYNCIVLLKDPVDVICSPEKCMKVTGGNAGMTKGGTGDVLAGLTAALNCKNEPFLSACAASFFNKKAGDLLYKQVGPFFNASDVADALPEVMKKSLNL